MNWNFPGLLVGCKPQPCSHVSIQNCMAFFFNRQLDDLVTSLGVTEPHYIKCIKPNSGKAPGGWSSPLVIEQLRYSGVLEVRVSCPTNRSATPELVPC